MARIMQHEWMNSGACEAIEAEDEGITRVLFSEERRSGDMRFINVSESKEIGDLAINLDEIKYARHVGGKLELYFQAGADGKLILRGDTAQQVWNEIIRRADRWRDMGTDSTCVDRPGISIVG